MIDYHHYRIHIYIYGRGCYFVVRPLNVRHGNEHRTSFIRRQRIQQFSYVFFLLRELCEILIFLTTLYLAFYFNCKFQIHTQKKKNSFSISKLSDYIYLFQKRKRKKIQTSSQINVLKLIFFFFCEFKCLENIA